MFPEVKVRITKYVLFHIFHVTTKFSCHPSLPSVSPIKLDLNHRFTNQPTDLPIYL